MAAVVGALGYLSNSSNRDIQARLERMSRSAVVDVVVVNDMTLAQTASLIAAHELVAEKNRSQADPELAESAHPEIKKQAAAVQSATEAIDRAITQARKARRALERENEQVSEAHNENQMSKTSKTLGKLEYQSGIHRQLMHDFLAICDLDVSRANEFLEHEVQLHYSRSLLPTIAMFKAEAEEHFTTEMRSVQKELAANISRNNAAVLLALLAALFLGVAVSRAIGRPLTRVTKAALAIGQGQLDTRVVSRGLGELGTLVVAFNQMAASLKSSTVSLSEKEVLLREVHHRVKNNLQIVSSLLNMQASEAADGKTSQFFEESQARVRSMALIHELLYRSNSLSAIDFSDYAQELIAFLAQSHHSTFAGPDGQVQMHVEADHIPLALEQAIPCGLILNELASNALKHAFPAGRKGGVWVEFRTVDGKHRLTVRDNGVGISPGSIDRPSSLGLKIVRSLAGQLGGELQIQSDRDTQFTVEYPAGVTK